ncbi:MAG: hypothetical protein ACYSQY_12150 [Planctomycetota bacterium]
MTQKICTLVKKGLHTKNPKKFMSLVRGSRYLCANCGRNTAEKEGLGNTGKELGRVQYLRS